MHIHVYRIKLFIHQSHQDDGIESLVVVVDGPVILRTPHGYVLAIQSSRIAKKYQDLLNHGQSSQMCDLGISCKNRVVSSLQGTWENVQLLFCV